MQISAQTLYNQYVAKHIPADSPHTLPLARFAGKWVYQIGSNAMADEQEYMPRVVTPDEIRRMMGWKSCEGTAVNPIMPGFLAALSDDKTHMELADGSVVYSFQLATPGYGIEDDTHADCLAALQEVEQENQRLRSLLARVLDPMAWEQGLKEEIEAELAESEAEDGLG